MSDAVEKNQNNWQFPSLELEEESEACEINDQAASDEGGGEISSQDKNELKSELVLLKSEYENKINLLNQLLHQVDSLSSDLNGEMVDIIDDIIKKVVKKLIFKEIEIKPEIIQNIIVELTNSLTDKESIVSIMISKNDFDRLDMSQLPFAKFIQVDHELKTGDVIIKSHLTELRALLGEQIDKVLEQ